MSRKKKECIDFDGHFFKLNKSVTYKDMRIIIIIAFKSGKLAKDIKRKTGLIMTDNKFVSWALILLYVYFEVINENRNIHCNHKTHMWI